MGVRHCLPSRLAPVSAAEGKAAEAVGRRTSTALASGIRLTAAVPGTGAGRRPVAQRPTSAVHLRFCAALSLRQSPPLCIAS